MSDANISTITDDQLVVAAKKVLDNAYCPYSKFQVGAAILTDSGKIFKGANYENASYPVGVCAERVALGAALSTGHRCFTKIAIATTLDEPGAPCGMCRQAIAEFGSNIQLILCSTTSDKRIIHSISHLLPYAFTSESLPKKMINDVSK